MIRVVLTVLLAVALVAVSLPALDDARTETTVERIGSEAERIERAAAEVTTDSVAVDEPALAARASHVVRAPTGFDAAPMDELTLVSVDSGRIGETNLDRIDGTVTDGGNGGRITSADIALIYHLRGEPVRAIPIPTPADAVEIAVVDGPIELRSAGESRIEFRFVTGENGAVIRISRAG